MKTKIGSWTFPSGNTCDVSLEQDTAGMIHAWFWWDEPPPLSPEDEVYYMAVLLPTLIAKLGSLGQGGTA